MAPQPIADGAALPRTVRPRRRWFRFSLRTLFVLVGVLAIGFAWPCAQWKTVLDRRQAIREIESAGGIVDVFLPGAMHTVDIDGMRPLNEPLPWMRRVLGDVRVIIIMLPAEHSSGTALDRIGALFPDAVKRRRDQWHESRLITGS